MYTTGAPDKQHTLQLERASLSQRAHPVQLELKPDKAAPRQSPAEYRAGDPDRGPARDEVHPEIFLG